MGCRHGFDPWVGKIPWRKERLPTPVFWSREFHGLYQWGLKESVRTEQLSLHFQNILLCKSQQAVENSSRDENTRPPDPEITDFLRNLYAGQEATVRTGHTTTNWFQIGKGVRQGCILSPYLFNFYAEYIM